MKKKSLRGTFKAFPEDFVTCACDSITLENGPFIIKAKIQIRKTNQMDHNF